MTSLTVAPIPHIDERLKAPCAQPVEAALAQTVQQVRDGWNADRKSLRECINRHGGLVQAVNAVEAWGEAVGTNR